tara:strand:- start:3237 stop:3488 length:252 start_codon:yes stop_codon:yes gene_type:complete
MSEITEKDIKNSEKYGYVNTTKLLKFIDSIVDELNDLENEIDSITDSSVGDVQYSIDDCSHIANSIKEELTTFFYSDWMQKNK